MIKKQNFLCLHCQNFIMHGCYNSSKIRPVQRILKNDKSLSLSQEKKIIKLNSCSKGEIYIFLTFCVIEIIKLRSMVINLTVMILRFSQFNFAENKLTICLANEAHVNRFCSLQRRTRLLV